MPEVARQSITRIKTRHSKALELKILAHIIHEMEKPQGPLVWPL